MSDGQDPSDAADHVCIRAPNWVGDVVMATAAFRAVRQGLPGAHVTLVVRSSVEPVLRGAPWFDSTVVYRPDGPLAAGEFLRCVGRLRRPRHGLGLVLPNSFSSALMFRLAGVRRRVGYVRDLRSALLTDAVPRPSENGRFRPTYMVDYYLTLCERAGLKPAGRQMELPFSDGDMARARAALQGQGVEPEAPLFLMHPGAGYGPSKRWPNESFGRLAGMLQAEFGAQVALVAGPAERDNTAAILAASRARVADLTACGIDLHLLKCVVALSRLLVTTDSGPRHYGVALGVPTVCLMGPTHPGYSTGTQPNDHVLRVEVDCGPCQLKVCPQDHRCMEDITPEMAMRACRDALSHPGRKATQG
jgi:heptosyltransferase-2